MYNRMAIALIVFLLTSCTKKLPRERVIYPGESIATIAEEYGVSIEELKETYNILDDQLVYPCIVLKKQDAHVFFNLSTTSLGDGDFRAILGGSRKDGKKGPPWNKYSIWIFRNSTDEIHKGTLLYYRGLWSSDVSPQFWTNRIGSLMHLSKDAGTVTIETGLTNYVCRIPAAYTEK